MRLENIALARLLLEAGANANAKNEEDATPLSLAKASAHGWKENTGSVPKEVQELIDLLRQHGAK